jgi:hypothetical protein
MSKVIKPEMSVNLRRGRPTSESGCQTRPAKPGPVFVVSVNHNSEDRVALDVADAVAAGYLRDLRFYRQGHCHGRSVTRGLRLTPPIGFAKTALQNFTGTRFG